MDVQVKELIEKIKSDGVKTAEQQASAIIKDAEEKAAAIIKKAQDEAASLKVTAKADAEKSERSGKEALRQAGRDLILTVKGEIENIFGKILTQETASTLDGAVMEEAVANAVKALSSSDSDLEVQIPESSMSKLESGLKSKLAKEFSNGIEIKPYKGLNAGFRVSKKDGSAFYDFSDSEIASLLSKTLNSKLAELLTE